MDDIYVTYEPWTILEICSNNHPLNIMIAITHTYGTAQLQGKTSVARTCTLLTSFS